MQARRSRAVEVRLALLAVTAALLAVSPVGVSGQEGPSDVVRFSLGDAVVHAVRASEAMQVAEAGLMRARGDRFNARSGFLPRVNGQVGYTRTLSSEFSGLTKPPADSSGNPFEGLKLPFGQANRYDLGVQATQTVFAGGQILARSRMADAGVRTARVGVAGARAQLELDVTRAYYDAVLSDRLVTIAEAAFTQADATLAQVSAARGVGESAEFDVLRAQVTRDNQKPQVIQRRAARDLAYMRLKQLLDVRQDAQLELTTTLSAPRDLIAQSKGDAAADDAFIVLESSSSDRGAVRQATELVAIREQHARTVSAQRLPGVALTTQWNRLGYPSSGAPTWKDMRSNWTVGVQLQLPLVTGGAQRGAELKAQADVAEARARLEQTRDYAALDARAALQQLETARASWDASSGTVEQAERAYRIAEIRFREGLSTQVELSDARLMLQQAEVNRAVAARDLEIAKTVIRLLPDLPLMNSSDGVR